jgi:hypothetical protein
VEDLKAMTLLNAPEFDEKKENKKRNILVGSGIFVVATILLTVAGFLLGHGWLFINLPVEHRVNVFLTAVQAKDYPKAYGIWNNDPDWQQHPQKYDYTLQRFTEDFTTESAWKGPVGSFHVDISKRDATGTVVAATINGGTNLTLKYQRSDGTLSFFPFELVRGL